MTFTLSSPLPPPIASKEKKATHKKVSHKKKKPAIITSIPSPLFQNQATKRKSASTTYIVMWEGEGKGGGGNVRVALPGGGKRRPPLIERLEEEGGNDCVLRRRRGEKRKGGGIRAFLVSSIRGCGGAVCIYYATHKHYSRSIILIRLENGIPDTNGIFKVLKGSPV